MKRLLTAFFVLFSTAVHAQQQQLPPVEPNAVIGDLVLGNVQQQRVIEGLRAQVTALQAEVKRLKDKHEPELSKPDASK